MSVDLFCLILHRPCRYLPCCPVSEKTASWYDMLYDSTAKQDNAWNYNEEEAKNSGNLETVGHKLIDKLLQL